MTLKSGEEADTTKKRKRDFGEEVEVDFEEAEKENEADLEQEVEVDLGDAAEEENDADLEQVEEETPAGQTWEDVALRMKEKLKMCSEHKWLPPNVVFMIGLELKPSDVIQARNTSIEWTRNWRGRDFIKQHFKRQIARGRLSYLYLDGTSLIFRDLEDGKREAAHFKWDNVQGRIILVEGEEKPEEKKVKTEEKKVKMVDLLASCHGFVLVRVRVDYTDEGNILLINPVTRTTHEVPPIILGKYSDEEVELDEELDEDEEVGEAMEESEELGKSEDQEESESKELGKSEDQEESESKELGKSEDQEESEPSCPIITSKPLLASVWGLGYRESTQDYLVVRIEYEEFEDRELNDAITGVYSVRDRTWTMIPSSKSFHDELSYPSGVYLDGDLFFMARNAEDYDVYEIAQFNLEERRFKNPMALPIVDDDYTGVAVLGEKLALWSDTRLWMYSDETGWTDVHVELACKIIRLVVGLYKEDELILTLREGNEREKFWRFSLEGRKLSLISEEEFRGTYAVAFTPCLLNPNSI